MNITLDKLRTPSLVLLHDLLMIPLAWMGAYWLRFNLESIPEGVLLKGFAFLPWVVATQGIIFYYFRLYRSLWRFASLPDLLQIAKAVLMGTACIAVGGWLYDRLESIPRSVPFIYSALLPILIGTPRLIYRSWKDQVSAFMTGKRTLVVGAGRAGEMLVRDLLQANAPEYRPMVLVDDDSKKKGREIRGIRVAGGCQKIPRLVKKYRIDAILIAIPSASDRQMRRIVEYCEQTDVPFLTLPSLKESLFYRMLDMGLREVSIEDLLGREPAQLDWQAIRTHLRHKTVLITGAGGSIGSELCRQLASMPMERLILFELCEYNLFRIENDLRRCFPELPIVPVLGNITEPASVRQAMETHRPQIVFHAAAYKHVPLLENQLREAVYNNCLGTRIVAEAAIEAEAEEFVLISTDKAVNPCNVMGATKRAAEMICQSLDSLGSTRFLTVRFGNVLDSAGSVVPLFREQIRMGGPVTVTHPEISRYFMTIPEACQLIMQAATAGQGGEIFILDMGEPIKIRYLAEQMIRLSGKRPGIDIEIRYVGLRPGERLNEELFHRDENLVATVHQKLLLAHSRPCDPRIIAKLLDQMVKACQTSDESQIMILLRTLVPEYRPQLTLERRLTSA
ncbi:MAG: polysaccharide biosynthesis protein [Methylohalobius sp. ZOD2]|nr:polysaccharide biosynthesis protein [Methylothermaceae bacterium]